MPLVPSTRGYKDTHKCIKVLTIVIQYRDANIYFLLYLKIPAILIGNHVIKNFMFLSKQSTGLNKDSKARNCAKYILHKGLNPVILNLSNAVTLLIQSLIL